MITISEEKFVDYEIRAEAASEAFGSSEIVFSADRMRWLYERGFGQGTIVLAVTDDGIKIGQIALVHQTIHCDGKPCSAIQLVDLFISKDHRSPQLIRRIYKEIDQLCVDRKIRFILAMPTQNAKPPNSPLPKLNPLLCLPDPPAATSLP